MRRRWQLGVAALGLLFIQPAASVHAGGLLGRRCEVEASRPLRFGVYPGNTFSFGKYVGLAGTNEVDPVGDLATSKMVELAAGRPFDVHFYAQWDGVRVTSGGPMSVT